MSEQQIFKICLTGGPCSGKTTSLTRIVETFSPEFIVYTLPEIATMTFSSGVTIIPSEFTEESHKQLISGICQMQIDVEKYFQKIAQTQKKKVLIISDRGVCDNFAYCSPENKDRVLNENGWTMNFLCNERYDMVIHLVTAAIGAEDFYSLENNSARSETKEQAAALDYKLQQEWMSHPNFNIIDNQSGGFQKKIDRILATVSNLIGAKTQHKIVKKFLLEREYLLKELPTDIKYEEFIEEQTILVTNKPDVLVWVFKRIYKGHFYPIYVYVTRSISQKHERRRETHKIISERNYFDFLAQQDSKYATIKKSIISFLYKTNSEFNIYHVETIKVNDERYFTLKIIRDSEHDEANYVPEFLKVTEDITEDPKYFSANIARIK